MARLDAHYIKFKGSSSATMGCHVSVLPVRSMAEAKGENVDIIGRNGSLFIAQMQNNGLSRSYKNTSIKVTLFPNANADLDAIRTWISGSGELIISDEAQTIVEGGVTTTIEYGYDANVVSAIPYTSARSAYGVLSIEVTFDCAPLRHRVGESEITFTNQGSVAGQGNQYALPLLTVTTTSNADVTLLINGVSVLISNLNGTLKLDCDAQYAYNGSTNLCGKVSIVSDPRDNDPDLWPYLNYSGSNLISWTCSPSALTASTTVKMQPRWRWR